MFLLSRHEECREANKARVVLDLLRVATRCDQYDQRPMLCTYMCDQMGFLASTSFVRDAESKVQLSFALLRLDDILDASLQATCFFPPAHPICNHFV